MRRLALIFLCMVFLTGAACFTLAQTRPATAPRTAVALPPAASPSDSALNDLTEYMDRSARLKESDVDGRLVLGRWARDHKMWSQASEMANQALYRDPGNRAAYLILQQVDDARPLPAEPDVEKSMAAESTAFFKHDFKTRNSKHFLLCYDTTDAFAIQRGVVMEKVYDAFQFYFTMNTLRPDFLEQRLVVILLKNRDDYLTYAMKSEGTDMGWSAGFFSQRTNRSIFFDDSSGTALAGVTQQAGDLRVKIDALNKQITEANTQNQLGLMNTLMVERNRAGETLAQLNSRADSAALMLNNTKTMHEAAHQVAFNMGIQARLVDYPLWFSEGLACSFEVEDSQGHRGPALLNFGRIAGIKDLIKDDKLVPLDPFITAPLPVKMDDASVSTIYCEGWGLFHYLYKFHRDGMEKYLLAYKTHAPLRAIGPDERKVIFTKAFGDDLEGLNKKFVAYLKTLPARPN